MTFIRFRKPINFIVLLGLLALAGVSSTVLATRQVQKIQRDNGTIRDEFGFSVAVDGDTMLVSALGQATKGSVYVFTRSAEGWVQQANLATGDPNRQDTFGISVDLDGDTALIGAFTEGVAGAAYVYSRNGAVWTPQAKLVPSDGEQYDLFARFVALDGDTALIGAIGDDDQGEDSGSAYVFTRNGTIWNEQAKLTPSDGTLQDYFGRAVALDGDTAVIGSPGDDNVGIDAGAAYVFTRNGTVWQEEVKLIAGDGTTEDFFGISVDVESNTALIGADGDDNVGFDTGAAYVFSRNGNVWQEEAKLVPTDGMIQDFFGISVDLDGNKALIGAYLDDDLEVNSGSAYIFTRDEIGWTQIDKLRATDSSIGDNFGISVAMDSATIVVGAFGKDNSKGAAYIFNHQDPLSGVAIEMLPNTSFEIDTVGNTLPNSWQGKNTEGSKRDKLVCDKLEQGKLFAHTGSCAFMFKGNPNGGKSKIQVTLSQPGTLSNSVTLNFSAYIDPRSSTVGRKFGRVEVKLTDGNKVKLQLSIPSGSSYIQQIDTSTIDLTGRMIESMTADFRYNGRNGKLIIDDVSLTLLNSALVSTLPLP